MNIFTKRVPLPEGVTVAAAIGERGRHVRAIGAAHRVRCIVDTNTMEFVLKGSAVNVRFAHEDVTALFGRIRAASQERTDGSRDQVQATAPQQLPFIHQVAVVVKHSGSNWRFTARPSDELKEDVLVQDFKYCLEQTPGDDHGPCATSTAGWIKKFDSGFRQRMTADMAAFLEEEGGNKLKLKAGFGLTCFALQDPDLTKKTMTFSQLQSLSLTRIRPRWSNVWNGRSDAVCKLVDTLEPLAAEQNVASRVTLTVYIGTYGASIDEDIAVKYWYNEQQRQWEPVAHDVQKKRVSRAVYDIAVENGTSIRVRAYTHDQWRCDDMAPHLETRIPANGSAFDTIVTLRSSFPRTSFIRTKLIKKKRRVDFQGLRFSLSYFNDHGTLLNVQCHLLDNADAGDGSRTLPHNMQALLDKMLGFTQ